MYETLVVDVCNSLLLGSPGHVYVCSQLHAPIVHIFKKLSSLIYM